MDSPSSPHRSSGSRDHSRSPHHDRSVYQQDTHSSNPLRKRPHSREGFVPTDGSPSAKRARHRQSQSPNSSTSRQTYVSVPPSSEGDFASAEAGRAAGVHNSWVPTPRLPPPKDIQPTVSYLDACAQPASEYMEDGSELPQKLLVLDLNGALVFRDKFKPAGGRGVANVRRVTPRPYLHFLETYLVTPEDNWAAMVWSSAQPRSVEQMVEQSFHILKRELAATWNRTFFDLSSEEFHSNVTTLKDLQKPWHRVRRQDGTLYDPKTTVLLDDSTDKALHQPFNHLCISEFTQEAAHEQRNHFFTDRPPASPRQSEEERQHDSLREDLSPIYDKTLIAVVGILSRLQHETNVGNWIQAGGLWAGYEPLPPRPASQTSATTEEAADQPPGPGNDATVPSDATPPEDAPKLVQPMWFEHPEVFEHWVEQGKQAARRMNFVLQPFGALAVEAMERERYEPAPSAGCPQSSPAHASARHDHQQASNQDFHVAQASQDVGRPSSPTTLSTVPMPS